jgi:3,5-epimerase/4-reductase
VTRTLVFGAGWIGPFLARRLPGGTVSSADVADPEAVAAEIERARPDRVVNAAGKTGGTSVDACETEPEGTWRSNVTGAVVLATECRARGIHLTHLGSGCVYEGDRDGRGWREEDPPNFTGSVYSRSKIAAEEALRGVGALQLRLRLPFSAVPHPRNLLTKLLSFRSVVSLPNSVTVLEDFAPVARALMERGETGVWNVVNEGIERHDEVLALWRDLVEPERRIDVVSWETLAAGLRAPRSNCVLSTEKLRAAGLALPPLYESLPRLVREYATFLRAGAFSA